MPPLDLDLPPALSHAARSNRHLADQVAETAAGSLAAQKAIDAVRSGADRETVWLRFTELAACRGACLRPRAGEADFLTLTC